MFKLASLIVEIVAESSSLDRALSRTHANLSTANVALGTFAGNVAASFARMAIGAAGGLFEGTVRSASHLGETMNKVKVVLGDSSSKIIANADDMAERFGLVRKEIIDAGSSFALLGKEMGMSGNESADFGVKLTKLAADATSLSDIPMDRMLEKLRSGLAGQVRPLRELGIFMTKAAVDAEAARMGLKPGASGQLSEGDKIKARVSFIENSEFMKKASGDLARTLGETENQTRKFWGTLSNLGTSIGEELNPAWNKLIQSFNTGLNDLKGYFEANKSMVRDWGDAVVEGFETAKVVWRNLPDTLEIALLGADQKMEDARAKIEAWATKIAVAIEKPFLKGAQSAGNYFKKAQDLVQTGASYGAAGLEKATGLAKSGAEMASKYFDYQVRKTASEADVAFRPIRDFANFAERKAGVGDYKQMSVEEDIGRLKGGLSGIPKALAELGSYFKIYQDVASESIKEKPKDFTSSLIDKANKHLADTLAKNKDVSSRGIAEAAARITKRETERLATMAEETWLAGSDPGKIRKTKAQREADEAWLAGSEPSKKPRKMTRAEEIAWLAGSDKMDQKEAVQDAVLGGKGKHHKGLEDTASFLQNMAAEQLGGDVQEKQLTELQAIRAADQKNADMMEKMYNKMAKAAYS